MPDATTPQGSADAALSFDQSVNDITALLPDSEVLNLGEEEQTPDEQDGENEPGPDDVEATDGDTDQPNEENPDGSGAYSKGRFAADDAKVTLNDGSVVTITDLKRGFMSQQAFTRKTTEHAREAEAFREERETVRTLAQTLQGERDFLMRVAGEFLPKEPDASMLDVSSQNYDPVGYTHQQAEFNRRREALQRLMGASKAEQTRAEQEKQRAYTDLVATEREKLHSVMPELQNSETFSKFWGEASKVMAEYGFSEADLKEALDHRFYPVMRDLARYKRALAKAPKAKEQVQAKPKLLPGGKRMDPTQRISRDRQGLAERQRRSGSTEDTVARLENLI